MRRATIFFVAWFLVPCLSFAAPTSKDPTLSISEITSGLSAPTTMAFIGSEDILVLQKNDGRVRRVIAGVLQADPVLDVAVDGDSERGMLGIALHPDFPTTPFIYLYYTESSTGNDSSGAAAANRMYRYTWNGKTLTTPLLVLDLPASPGPNHDGGIILFGPDGKLYVVIGDLNRDGQLQNFPSGAGADDTSVILRINADGSVPTDNPFFSQGGNLAKYYAYGIRNSFGLAFDPLTDELWMTENGPGSYDEINHVLPGFNSGWEQLMGPDARNANNASGLVSFPGSHYADPKFSWLNTVGPTAIVFLDSDNLGAQYENDVFVGDINNGNLYRFRLNSSRDGFVFNGGGLADRVADNSSELNETILATGFAGITDLKVGPDGRLYVVSIGDGKIYAIAGGNAPLAVAAANLPPGEVGVAYSVPLDVSGGVEPYTLSVVNGTLPEGLAIVGEMITGTPAQVKKGRVTVRVTDQQGAVATKRLNLTVVGAVIIANQTLPSGRTGRRYKAQLKAKAGRKPYAWSLVGGSLPAGLSLNPSTGAIIGTPETPTEVSLTFRVADALGGAAQKALTLAIR